MGLLMVPQLKSSLCVTCLELTIHGCVEVVVSLERLLIVFHSLRVVCVRSVDITNYSHLFFFYSVIMLTSLVSASLFISPNRLLEFCFWYASCRLCDSSYRAGVYCSLHLLGICFLEITHINSMNLT